MKSDLQEILNDALDELKERMKDYPDEDADDVVSEIADSSVPVYYSDLLKLASGCNDLATAEPECGPAFDGKPTPVNIIAANVYEAVDQHLRNYLSAI
ncbi:hypothetical protein LCGC14_0412560 [marine sediment metagenome]|uniref:Uncharacterized protein n=1 Tax=marine sediment metagenome TaxID=412755 RepID=A0A0F9STN1_9ZZZZ